MRKLTMLLRASAVAALVTGSLTIWAPAAVAVPPPAATTLSPSDGDVVGTTTPTYTWTAAGSGATLATAYRLHVRRTSGTVIDRAYSAAQARCATGGRCSITPTPPDVLAPGDDAYSWNVASYNAAGWGPWGRWRTFQVAARPPKATLIYPVGTINEPLPTYTWNAAGAGVTRATWYLLHVQTDFTVPGQDSVIIYKRMTAAEAGCGDAAAKQCRTRGITGGPGPHTWWIQAGNAATDDKGISSGSLAFVRR